MKRHRLLGFGVAILLLVGCGEDENDNGKQNGNTQPSPPPAQVDLASGEKIFKKCKGCHTLKDEGRKKIGPPLGGLFGRTSGTVEGYKYSKAMKDAEIVWTDETLRQFLANPKKEVSR